MHTRYTCLAIPFALVVAACSSERSDSTPRDLTLLPSAESATDAVASARELDLPRAEPEQKNAAGASALTPVPARVHARQAKRVDRAAKDAPVTAPDPEPAPESPAPGPRDVASAGGAGTPLDPGQTVTVLPVSGGTGPQPLPVSDVATEGQIRRPWIVIGDDRCIPGRGEVMPRGHRGFRLSRLGH
jgi:hypothetical protein